MGLSIKDQILLLTLLGTKMFNLELLSHLAAPTLSIIHSLKCDEIVGFFWDYPLISYTSSMSPVLMGWYLKQSAVEFLARQSSPSAKAKIASTTRSGPIFTLFPDLPPELRDMIWKFALPGPSVVEMYQGHETQGRFQLSQHVQQPVASLMRTCR